MRKRELALIRYSYYTFVQLASSFETTIPYRAIYGYQSLQKTSIRARLNRVSVFSQKQKNLRALLHQCYFLNLESKH